MYCFPPTLYITELLWSNDTNVEGLGKETEQTLRRWNNTYISLNEGQCHGDLVLFQKPKTFWINRNRKKLMVSFFYYATPVCTKTVDN